MRTLSTQEIATVTGAGRRGSGCYTPPACEPTPPACNTGGSSSSNSYSYSSSYSYSYSSSYSYSYSRSWSSPVFYW